MQLRRGTDRFRGGDPTAGIDSRYALSFSGFYDPDQVRFGPLAACNEERLAPGAGFAEHPHRDLEIVTWVLEGELTHQDSAGHRSVVRPGDVQRLSAGSGVRHSERNDAGTPLRFLQMWLVPGALGGAPDYEVVRGIADSTPYALPRTDAVLHLRRLRDGQRTAVPDADWVWIQLARGAVRLCGERLTAGDAARIARPRPEPEPVVTADGPAEVLLWEMHAGRPGG